MNVIDSLLNRITMYRLVLYGLIVLVGAAFVLSATNVLDFGIGSLTLSLAVLLIVCRLGNGMLAALFRANANVESSWITALILFLVVSPPTNGYDVFVIGLAGALAIASKFFLSIGRKHLFNPAAIAILILSLAGSGIASWWVGTPALLPFVLVIGLLIVRKIRRYDVWFAFMGATAIVTIVNSIAAGSSIVSDVMAIAYSGPLIFFSTIMLTEPLTMPPTRSLRIVFGIIVGAISASSFHFLSLYSTPQFALIAGNLYAYLVGSKQLIKLSLLRIERLSTNVYEFVFRPNEKLAFAAGQYLEWTLPHEKPDSRGNRRYFTIASNPNDELVRLGVRIDENPSTYKRALLSLSGSPTMTATALAGDFTLPENKKVKLAFIAGGVGITPFASMLREELATNSRRDIVIFYATSPTDRAYHDLLSEAERTLGIRVIFLHNERLTQTRIIEALPDYTDRTFYLSGPNAMVTSYKDLLFAMRVARNNIHTDYFPGF